ncbi:hypothetical protein ACX93W_19610 [Paenibacillus sp. CAU 1782]
MNKTKLLLLALATSTMLAGCSGPDNKTEPTDSALVTYRPDNNETAYPFKIAKEIEQVTLNKANSHSSVDNTNIKTFDDENTKALFQRVVQSAVPMAGILDTTQPDYHFELASADGQHSFFLWLDETSDQAMLMEAQESHTGYSLSKEITDELKKLLFQDLNNTISNNQLSFQTVRQSDGTLVAKPVGFDGDGYHLNSSNVLELNGTVYHNVQLFYSVHKAINALIAHEKGTDEVQVKWSDSLNNSDNHWNNAFMNSYNMLLPLPDNRILFLESELIENEGAYHLSAYNTETGALERLRENFWPGFDTYDYIYQYKWNIDEQKLLLQSFLGNVWIFDLKTGKDITHLNTYKVPNHSTTGLPSLFVSPTLERFAFDDESGKLTFYSSDGTALNKVELPAGQNVPSDKIKWSAAGNAAWMELAPEDEDRILGIDVDYLRIAPKQVQFFNADGEPIGSLTAGDKQNASLEVAGWINADVAVIKSYTAAPAPDQGVEAGMKEISYYLYDVWKKNKGPLLDTMPPETIPVMESRGWASVKESSPVTLNSEEIIYSK